MKKCFTLIIGILTIYFTSQNVFALELKSNGLYENYNGIIMTSEELDNLKNLGFTDKQIYLMDFDEYTINKDLNGTVLTEITKYYKVVTKYPDDVAESISSMDKLPTSYSIEISENEYNNSEYEIQKNGLSDGNTETNYKKMTTTIISVNGRYRYKNTLVWKKVQKNRSYDIMAIGIDSTVSGISNTKYFKRTADILGSNTCYFDTSTSGTWKLSSTGYGVTFELPNDSINYTVQGLEMYMYFEVQKLTSNTIKTLNAYGDYKHAINTVSPSVSSGFSVDADGISFDASVSATFESSYDSISTAQATWSNLNW